MARQLTTVQRLIEVNQLLAYGDVDSRILVKVSPE
jgi:hypothetical protein